MRKLVLISMLLCTATALQAAPAEAPKLTMTDPAATPALHLIWDGYKKPDPAQKGSRYVLKILPVSVEVVTPIVVNFVRFEDSPGGIVFM